MPLLSFPLRLKPLATPKLHLSRSNPAPHPLRTQFLSQSLPQSTRQISIMTESGLPLAPQSAALTRYLPLRGSDSVPVSTPRLIYGTAWKKEKTADYVYQALKSGFRAIDTAAQPRHYREDLVGDGIRRAIEEGIVSRKDLFIQTKFTSVNGQDKNNLPYDPSATVADQVHASVQSSLRHLATPDAPAPYLDSLVLHSPLETMEATIEAWTALATYVPHAARRLGISNADLDAVQELHAHPFIRPEHRPAVVQNRFHAATLYEAPLRAWCRERAVVFQCFWTLSGNAALLRRSAVLGDVARGAGVAREVALYALVLGLEGTAVLDGTTDPAHMVEDLEGLETVGRWAEGEGKEAWAASLAEFKGLLEPKE